MSVMVLVECQVKPDMVDEFTSFIASLIDETRAYDGCNSMTFNVDQDDPAHIVFVESWDSREKYEAYFAWRAETGALDQLGPMLATPPAPKFFDDAGI